MTRVKKIRLKEESELSNSKAYQNVTKAIRIAIKIANKEIYGIGGWTDYDRGEMTVIKIAELLLSEEKSANA